MFADSAIYFILCDEPECGCFVIHFSHTKSIQL